MTSPINDKHATPSAAFNDFNAMHRYHFGALKKQDYNDKWDSPNHFNSASKIAKRKMSDNISLPRALTAQQTATKSFKQQQESLAPSQFSL
jgi:hypothetical protein